jgi:hypothetical protein
MSEQVPLTTAPNVPLAEVLCGRLREAGIPSYYKDASVFGGPWGGSGANPSVPVEIYVNLEDLERARGLLAGA